MSKFFSIILTLLLLTLVACSTTVRTIDKDKLVLIPSNFDIDESVQILFDSRPPLEPDTPTDTEADNYYLALAYSYKEYGDSWMDYSFRLEDYLEHLKLVLKEPASGQSE